jgi:hypothetical protein
VVGSLSNGKVPLRLRPPSSGNVGAKYLPSAERGSGGGGNRGPRVFRPLGPARGTDGNPVLARDGGAVIDTSRNDCSPNVGSRGLEEPSVDVS